MVKESISALLLVLAVPLWVLNTFGGVIGFGWLAFAGEWSLIGWGILGLFISAFGLSLAMAPAALFVLPAMSAYQRGNKFIGLLLGVAASLYTNAVIVFWCVAVLSFFLHNADSDTSLLPVLLWAYGAATGPLAYMASKEQNPQSITTTQFAQLAFLVSIVGVLFFKFSISTVTLIFATLMLLSVLISIALYGVTGQAPKMGATE
jgi:hypothetical protein